MENDNNTQTYKMIFKLVDVKSSGSLNNKQLRAGFRSLGYDLSEEQFNSLLTENSVTDHSAENGNYNLDTFISLSKKVAEKFPHLLEQNAQKKQQTRQTYSNFQTNMQQQQQRQQQAPPVSSGGMSSQMPPRPMQSMYGDMPQQREMSQISQIPSPPQRQPMYGQMPQVQIQQQIPQLRKKQQQTPYSFVPYHQQEIQYSAPQAQQVNSMSGTQKAQLQSYYTNYAMTHEKAEFQTNSFDVYNNPTGSDFDLGRDGCFNDFVVLIGNLSNGACAIQNSIAALHQKGFNVMVATDEKTFIEHLKESDVAWLIAGTSWVTDIDHNHFADAVITYHLSGKGLAIWADNDPYFQHANAVLEMGFDLKLIGNTPGNKTMTLADGKQKQTFGRHLLTSGITSLFEGITICYPENVGKMEVLATSSDDNPVILYMDTEPRGPLPPNVGRVVVDCAFTKLYCNWDTAGTARYVANISVWLLGLDSKMQAGQDV